MAPNVLCKIVESVSNSIKNRGSTAKNLWDFNLILLFKVNHRDWKMNLKDCFASWVDLRRKISIFLELNLNSASHTLNNRF